MAGFSSLRKHRLRLALWVAPALLLRALIPIGFMLAPVDGRTEIVICGSDAPGAILAHGAHDHLQHHQHSHADSTCPYAQSAAPAPLPALAVLPQALPVTTFSAPDAVQQTNPSFGPTREQSPRGPPPRI